MRRGWEDRHKPELPNTEALAVFQFSDGSKLILEEVKEKCLTDNPGELMEAMINIVQSLNDEGKGSRETSIIHVKLEEARRWLITKTSVRE